MLKIEHTEVMGWEAAIRGMRNPLNSWEQSDSFICEERTMTNAGIDATCGICPKHNSCDIYDTDPHYVLGNNDYSLMLKLRNAGTDHRKFMRMLTVYCDITAPLYWWKEYDTYKVGTVANSCSTMHKIHAKPIELSDFSIDDFYMDDLGFNLKDMFINVVANCEMLRQAFLTANQKAKYIDHFTDAEIKHFKRQAKRYWKGLIQLLPTGYNQKRTVMLNYEVLSNIYRSRRHHKLDEWHTLCDWIEQLPYAELITGKDG